MDPLDAQIRQVVLFDIPDLTLDRHGVVVPAGRVQREARDTVVKLRPLVPDEISADARRSPGFDVEVDAARRAAHDGRQLVGDFPRSSSQAEPSAG
jgi:hypothetical protein